MPTLTVELEEGTKTFEVTKGVRLVLALEDNGIDISHRCGGFAKCTTCRCSIASGEPETMTQAEKEKIQASLEGGDEQMRHARLSCQILVNEDITLTPLMRVGNADWDEPGGRPDNNITPNPVWTTK